MKYFTDSEVNMKDILNKRVNTESLQTFCSAILEEDCNEYFDLNNPSPYMLLMRK